MNKLKKMPTHLEQSPTSKPAFSAELSPGANRVQDMCADNDASEGSEWVSCSSMVQ